MLPLSGIDDCVAGSELRADLQYLVGDGTLFVEMIVRKMNCLFPFTVRRISLDSWERISFILSLMLCILSQASLEDHWSLNWIFYVGGLLFKNWIFYVGSKGRNMFCHRAEGNSVFFTVQTYINCSLMDAWKNNLRSRSPWWMLKCSVCSECWDVVQSRIREWLSIRVCLMQEKGKGRYEGLSPQSMGAET